LKNREPACQKRNNDELTEVKRDQREGGGYSTTHQSKLCGFSLEKRAEKKSWKEDKGRQHISLEEHHATKGKTMGILFASKEKISSRSPAPNSEKKRGKLWAGGEGKEGVTIEGGRQFSGERRRSRTMLYSGGEKKAPGRLVCE